ncbi:MAG: type 1 glutamine amidotransferase domain-containing protein [Methanospirillum sp.]
MSTIVALVGQGFEDVEYTKPAEAFRNAGHTVTVVGLKAGEEVRGKHDTPVRIERAVRDVTVDEFDVLFIPGGHSPDDLRIDPAAVEFVKKFVESGKPVLAICHAPQLLINARVLKGRRIAGWPSLRVDIENAGAEYVDEPVVEDGNIVSSRKPEDIPAFIEASLKRLG